MKKYILILMLLIPFVSATWTDGIVELWGLNATFNTSIAYPDGHNLSCSNSFCPTYTTNGWSGGAYLWNGTDGNINYANTSAFAFPSGLVWGLSVCMWVKADGFANYNVLFDKTDTFRIMYSDSKDLYCIYYDSAANPAVYKYQKELELNKWYYLCAVYNSSWTNHSRVQFYINGTNFTASDTSGDHNLSVSDKSTGIFLGVQNDYYREFNGTLDEVIMWNRSISLSESRYAMGIVNTTSIEIRDALNLSFVNITSLDIIYDNDTEQYSTTTGRFGIVIQSKDLVLMRYNSSSYHNNYYYLDTSDDTPKNLTLYLLPYPKTQNVTVTVYDNIANTVPNVYVRMLRYDITTNTYYIVEMAKTDSNGNAVFHPVLFEEFYEWQLYYPFGTLKLATTGESITSTTKTFQISTQNTVLDNFDSVFGITENLTFNNATDNFRLTFSSDDGLSKTVTLYVYQRGDDGKEYINSSTVTSSSATILVPVNVTNDTFYYAEAYVNFGGDDELLSTYTYIRETEMPLGAAGMWIVYVFTVIFAFSALFSIPLALCITPIPLILGGVLGIIPKTLMTGAILILIINIFLAVMIGKGGK